MNELNSYRGSRRHILEWVSQPGFASELATLIADPTVQLEPGAWRPLSAEQPAEATLDRFGPAHLAELPVWEELASWWLVHRRGAKTPTWDLVAPAMIDSRRGLILVEAKANVPELGTGGKPRKGTPSERSEENQAQIGRAIAEASAALDVLVPGVRLSVTSHYQLANRLAFTWKLAALGVPVVLVYLGFLNDAGISDAGEPFRNAGHWQKVLRDHCRGLVPEELWGRRLQGEGAPFRVLERSRERLSDSPRRGAPRHDKRPAAD